MREVSTFPCDWVAIPDEPGHIGMFAEVVVGGKVRTQLIAKIDYTDLSRPVLRVPVRGSQMTAQLLSRGQAQGILENAKTT